MPLSAGIRRLLGDHMHRLLPENIDFKRKCAEFSCAIFARSRHAKFPVKQGIIREFSIFKARRALDFVLKWLLRLILVD